jgi:hypothetical protein
MKKYFILIAAIFSAAIWSSCEEDNVAPLGNWEIAPSVIVLPENDTEILLDELTPNATQTFSWTPAIPTARYAVTYSIVMDTLGSETFDTPILEIPSSSNGKETSLAITNKELDTYLSYAGYLPNEFANVTWAVKAKVLDKAVYTPQDIMIKRFSTEIIPTRLYVSGTATENNNVLANAIEMKRLASANGTLSNKHEIYTSLISGKKYEFFSEKTLPCHRYGTNADGVLTKSGLAITANESGQFRISVDLDAKTYSLLKIEKWSIVGSPISGGWGGDVPLEYQGGGIWKSSVDLVATGGFAFRANGDWSYMLKKTQEAGSTLVMESDAASQGLTVQDVPSNNVGKYFVTLNLSSTGYNYSFVLDNTAPAPIATPNSLFLIANGSSILEFSKNGDIFSSTKFIPFQSTVNYTLNTQANGLGTSYSIGGLLGTSSTTTADKVTGNNVLTSSNNPFNSSVTRGLRLRIDFGQSKINWEYYNFKLFHWQNWDTRNEFVMTYQHPNTYKITTALNANYEMKFISPWDFEMGSSTPTVLSGNLINTGGSNMTCITTSGTYTATIVLSDDYQTATYTFVQQ